MDDRDIAWASKASASASRYEGDKQTALPGVVFDGDDVRVGKADGGRYSLCSLKAGRCRQDACRRCQEKERRLLSTYQGQKQAFPSNKTIEIQQRSASCREWGEGAGFKAQGARARGVN